MSRRIVPPDAFALWVALGMQRSYGAIARRYGVTVRAIVKTARRDSWQARLAEIDREADAMMDAALAHEKGEALIQHKRLVKAIAIRAGKALAEMPLASGWEGVRAAEVAIKLDRLLSGSSTEQTAVIVESRTRQEIDRFIKPPTEDLDVDEGDEPDDGDGEW